MKTLLFSLLMILTLSTVSYAGLDWEPLGETDTRSASYDPESLVQKGNPVSMATMDIIVDFHPPIMAKDTPEGPEWPVGSALSTMQFNCQKALQRVLSGEVYSGGSGSGTVRASSNTPQEWTPANRRSTAFNIACASKEMRAAKAAKEFEASEWGALARATKPNPKANKKLADSVAKLKGMINGPQEAMEEAELKRQLHRGDKVLNEYMEERCMAKTGRRC